MIFTAPTSILLSFQSAFFEITAMGEKQTNPPHPKKIQPTKKKTPNPKKTTPKPRGNPTPQQNQGEKEIH